MATTKTINVQYKLRGDTLANLEAKNAVYAVNEPIVVLIPADADNGTKAATLLKMGDGTTVFKDLPYITALAGDVPEWARLRLSLNIPQRKLRILTVILLVKCRIPIRNISWSRTLPIRTF